MQNLNLVPNPRYFKVYGEGVGGKAADLIRKTEPILETKFFNLEKRHVLGMSFFSDFLKRCGADEAIRNGEKFEVVKQLIDRGEFNFLEKKTIEGICRDLCEHQFLGIRSSAEGDARGTGVYESFYCLNKVEAVKTFVKKVLASHYTESATLFRRDAKLRDGIAVMIESLVVEEMNDSDGKKVWAPRFSGFGKTDSRAGPYIGVVQGFAANYVKDPCEGVVINSNNEYHPLLDIVMGESRPHHNKRSFFGQTLVITGEGEVTRRNIGHKFIGVSAENLLYDLVSIGYFFEMSQYIEWAVTGLQNEMKKHIIQIADITPLTYTFEIAEKERLSPNFLGTAHLVQGEGIAQADNIVYMNHSNGWKKLYDINKRGAKYFLIFNSDALTGTDLDCVSYSHFSNAVAIIEHGGGKLGNFGAHFGGLLAMVNRILLSTENLDMKKAWQRAESKESIRGESTFTASNSAAVIYKLPVEVLASEAQQKALIRIRE